MALTRLVIGAPVRGEDLWDRKREIGEVWKALEKDHVLLAAPRRFGKTSLMLRLRDAPREGYKVFYLDTEWVRSPADFVAEVAAELLRDATVARLFSRIGGLFEKAVDRIKAVEIKQTFAMELRDKVSEDWYDSGRRLISQLAAFDGNIVIVADELPLMVQKMLKDDQKMAEDFLYWLRGIRQMPELSNVRFVIGGSIGIEHILKKAGTGTKVIGDLHRIQIGPFSVPEARGFIKVLLRNEADLQRVRSALLDDFMEILETPVPYFIQILVSESIKEAGGSPLTPEVIHHAYRERVLAAYNRTYFEHYYCRLEDYYSEEEAQVAKAFLLEMARRGEVPRSDLWSLYRNLHRGRGDEEGFSYLLSDLENDFYIQFYPDKSAYRFATRVLRDWWLRHHGMVD